VSSELTETEEFRHNYHSDYTEILTETDVSCNYTVSQKTFTILFFK